MDLTRFKKPMEILVGLGFPRKIESAMEAYILLQNWPHGDRTGAHSVALNACKASIAGDVDPETAYAALRAFADRQGILLTSQAGWQSQNNRSLEKPQDFDQSVQ